MEVFFFDLVGCGKYSILFLCSFFLQLVELMMDAGDLLGSFGEASLNFTVIMLFLISNLL